MLSFCWYLEAYWRAVCYITILYQIRFLLVYFFFKLYLSLQSWALGRSGTITLTKLLFSGGFQYYCTDTKSVSSVLLYISDRIAPKKNWSATVQSRVCMCEHLMLLQQWRCPHRVSSKSNKHILDESGPHQLVLMTLSQNFWAALSTTLRYVSMTRLDKLRRKDPFWRK